jgi:hypothetical protein
MSCRLPILPTAQLPTFAARPLACCRQFTCRTTQQPIGGGMTGACLQKQPATSQRDVSGNALSIGWKSPPLRAHLRRGDDSTSDVRTVRSGGRSDRCYAAGAGPRGAGHPQHPAVRLPRLQRDHQPAGHGTRHPAAVVRRRAAGDPRCVGRGAGAREHLARSRRGTGRTVVAGSVDRSRSDLGSGTA